MQLLSEKEQEVLAAVVEQHIASAEPVSSQQLCRYYGLPCSPATVRNILARLEEKGFLYHPYTSAGKVPTVKAYRFFVESRLPYWGAQGADRGRLYHELLKHVQEEDKIISLTAKVLAVSSRLLAVTWMPTRWDERLAHLQLIPLGPHRILLVIHTLDGNEIHQVFTVDEILSRPLMHQVADLINRKAKGNTAEELERLSKAAWPGMGRATLRLLRQALRWTGQHLNGMENSLRIEGAANLMEQPEFNNVSATRQLVALLDQRETFVRSLEAPGIEQQGVRVVINERTMAEAMPALSLVSEAVVSSSRRTFHIGVVGPMRMDYGEIIPLVKNTAEVLLEIIDVKS